MLLAILIGSSPWGGATHHGKARLGQLVQIPWGKTGDAGLTDVIASQNLPDGLGWTVCCPAYHSPISMDREGQSP